MANAKIDYVLSKWASRKLMVFFISAFALFTGQLDGDNWVIVSTAYIGGEVILDAVTRLRGVKIKPEEEKAPENNKI